MCHKVAKLARLLTKEPTFIADIFLAGPVSKRHVDDKRIMGCLANRNLSPRPVSVWPVKWFDFAVAKGA